jgi:ferrous iron transport protein A
MPTLDEIPPGGHCRIAEVGGSPSLAQRLLEMGLMEGEEVFVITRAPLGDPIEVQSPLTRLSLRRSEAAQVRVTLPD